MRPKVVPARQSTEMLPLMRTEIMLTVMSKDSCTIPLVAPRMHGVRMRLCGDKTRQMAHVMDSSTAHTMRLRGGSRSKRGAPQSWAPWLLLNAVVMLWSSDECLIKHMLATGQARSPAFLNATRFSVAAVAFLPFLPSPWQRGLWPLWRSGADLGAWMFLGFATQTVGLQHTSVSRGAFLLYVNVLLVPLLARVLFARVVPVHTWLSCAMVLLGTLLLGCDGGAPNRGDAWCLLSAVFSAMFIVRLEHAAALFPAPQLQAASMVTIAVLCALWLVVTEGLCGLQTWPTRGEIVSATYLGLVPTALCSWLQTIGQRSVAAESAALIYALDPVYTAAIGALVLGERLGAKGVVGGALICIAALLNVFARRPCPTTSAD